MTKYIYINNNRKSNLLLGISTKVFEFIGKKALSKIDSLANNSEQLVTVATRNNTVVYKITVNVQKGVDKSALKEKINNELANSMDLLFDSLSFDTLIKINEKKVEKDGKRA